MSARVILFDLDGTLIRSHNGFVPFNEAIQKTFGIPADIRTVVPDGNTDPLILQDIFATANLEVEVTEARWKEFTRNLHDCYMGAVQDLRTRVFALSGVPELLREVQHTKLAHQGVVTGNLEVTGRLKLEAAGLASYLGFGAYGSDSPDRVDLPGIARERLEQAVGQTIKPEHCTVVGDTPRDLHAARENGMRCVLVGTGRYPVEELQLLEPEACLSDFTDTQESLEALLG